MRFLRLIVVGGIAGTGTACVAQSIFEPASDHSVRRDIISAAAELSQCALSCIITHAPEYGCELLDVKCQCDSAPLFNTLATCSIKNCTASEAIDLAKFGAQQCNSPTDHYHDQITPTTWVMMAFVFSSWGLRLISRIFVTRSLWWDDLFHTIAIVVGIPMNYSLIELGRLGFGFHLFQVEPENLGSLWLWFFIGQLLWAVCIMLLKTSIIFLYLRIFPGNRFRIACYAVLAICLTGATAFILVDLFQCNPISAGWTLQHGNATCMDFSIIAIGSAIFNLLTEIALFLLPMRTLLALNLPLGKKIKAIILLGIGIVVIVVAGIRITSLHTLNTYADATYRNYPAFLWTGIEITAAHVCVSAPAIAILFTSICRRINVTVQNSVSSGLESNIDRSKAFSGNSSTPSRQRVKLNSMEEPYGDEVELRQMSTGTRNESRDRS